jgi:hypothetical protein
MSAALVVVVLLVVIAAGTALFLFLRSRGKRAPSRVDKFLRDLSGLVIGAEERQRKLLELSRGPDRSELERA